MSSRNSHHRLIYALVAVIMATSYSCSSRKATVQPHPVVTRHVNISAASAPHTRLLLNEAEKWIGTPYKYGGTTRGEGVDCSGLVMSLYSDALSIKIPRNSAAQAEFCDAIEREELEVGDLVFFAPRSTGRVNHVGMYIGNGDMIHASGSSGVMVSSLSEAYFLKNFYGCGRVAQLASLSKTNNTDKGSKSKKKSEKKPTTTGGSNYDDAFSQLRQRVKDSKKAASPTDTATVITPFSSSREIFDEAIDQRVDSICSSFFD